MCLARILFSRGDLAGIEDIIHKVENITRVSNVPPWIVNQMADWQTRLWLAQNNLEPASQWAEERGFVTGGKIEPLREIDFFLLFDYIMLARVLIAQDRLDEAADLLQRLIEPVEAGGRMTRLIEILSLQALVFQAGDQITRAMVALERALTLAEPEGFIRIFLDESPPMVRLLHEALDRDIAPDYVRRLLASVTAGEQVPAGKVSSQAALFELVDPLSERELEVLQLIAEGLANREIADRLYLSLNTVKVHTRNIYGKLGVNSRMQAVAKARDLGALSSS